MILKIILLQLTITGLVLLVLKNMLEHDLLMFALETLEGFDHAAGANVKEVTVATGCVLPDQLAARFTSALKARFPQAETSMIVSKEIGGGIVIQIDGTLLDLSLTGRLKHLWGATT